LSPDTKSSADTAPQHRFVEAAGLRFHVVEGGTGPLVFLLAGFPQSCYAWRKVMPLLTPQHRVVAVDLPGQGDSDKPPDGYDTETTAARIHALAKAYGDEPYFLVGHDIGAWVTYPYAAHYPETLRGAVLIDGNIPAVSLKPTITIGPDQWRSWHFLFNSVADLPEVLLHGRERVLIDWFFTHKSANSRATFTAEDLDEYERCFQTPGGLRGMLGYYRAVLEDINQNSRLVKQPITVPLLAIGADAGSAPDLPETMRPLATNLTGDMITQSGHYIPEEQPAALANALLKFFEGNS
jgi:pimeloyl-ACP methyl ester carboxylesterase